MGPGILGLVLMRAGVDGSPPQSAPLLPPLSPSEDPVRLRAYSAISRAIRRGEVKRGPCSMCGSEKRTHGHHEDYRRPLDVTWLCPSCHGRRHRQIRANEAAFRLAELAGKNLSTFPLTCNVSMQ